MIGGTAKPVPALRLLAIAALLSAMAACAPTKVETRQSYQGSLLPRPEIVLVYDFIATPDEVKLDSGLGARLRNVLGKTSADLQQSEDDRKVTAAISKVLVAEIQKLGLPAAQANDASAGTRSNKLAIGGQILSIDEGNRTRRNIIGLGAGHSDVQARAEIYYYESGVGPRLLESFDADAQSSRKPGAAETLGAGAATGRVVESGAVGIGAGLAPGLSADIAADADRLAKAIAKRLADVFAKQGWLPAPARAD